MTLNELKEELGTFKRTVDGLLRKSGFQKYGDLSGLDMDYKDPEQVFRRNEYGHMLEQLADISATLALLEAPVIYTGTLSRRPDGRYGTEDGFYYTSGNPIEALVDDPEEGDPAQWVLSRVEFADDYYIVGYRNIKMEGLVVRRRKNPFVAF